LQRDEVGTHILPPNASFLAEDSISG